jgi:hypothetical protein
VAVAGPQRVVGATIDAQNVFPDVHRENNSWMERRPTPSSTAKTRSPYR